MTPFTIFICNKMRVHEIFFEIQIANNEAENFDFNFRI